MNAIISFTPLVSANTQNQISYPKFLLRRLAIISAFFAATACAPYNRVTGNVAQTITPYQITIAQGNFVSKEMAALLQVGMSQEDVKNLLGTPLITDMFHANRWDYVFYIKRGTQQIVEKRGLTLQFVDDRLSSWSDIQGLPSEKELVALIDQNKREKRSKKNIVEKTKDNAASNTAANSASEATSNNSKDIVVENNNADAPNQRASSETNEALATQSRPELRPERPIMRSPTPPAPMPQHPIPDAQIHLKIPQAKPLHKKHSSDKSQLSQPPIISPSN